MFLLRTNITGFNPTSLFASGEQGALYDTSDLSTMFQDATGQVPAVVGQPVGAMLDKAHTETVGAEYMASPNDLSDANWQLFGSGVSKVGTTIVFSSVASGNGVYQARGGGMPPGWYQITVVINSISSGSLRATLGANPSTSNSRALTTAGTHTFRYHQTEADHNLRLYSGEAGTSAVVGSISVKPLTGANHATQGTTSAKPILREHYDVSTAVEQVANGGFDSGASWGLGGGCTISGGVANVNTASFSTFLYQDLTNIPVGSRVKIKGTTTRTSGSFNVRVGNTETTPAVSASGAFEIDTLATGSNQLVFYTNAFVGTIDNMSVKIATPNGYYLEFDGVDDWMRSTFTIAQPWDRVSGLRRISYTYGSHLFGGVAANAGVVYQENETSLALFDGLGGVPVVPGFSVGTTAVLTERHSGASSRAAANNVAYVTGNPGTSVPGGVTIGANSGSGGNANIRFYGVAMIGRALTDAEITNLRTHFASKAGVTL
jgi:hypothetical protein